MRPLSTYLLATTAILPLAVLPALACVRAGPPPALPAPAVAVPAPAAPAPASDAAAPATVPESTPAAMEGSAPAVGRGHGRMRRGGSMRPMMSARMVGRMGSGQGMVMAGAAGCPMRAAMLASAAAPLDPATAAARLAQAAACPEPTEALATEGKGIFLGKGNCYTCHGMDAKGTPLAPSLMQHKWLNIDGSYAAIARLVTTGVLHPKEHPAPMPPMGGAQLTPSEVCAVSAYVYRLSHKS